MLLESTPGSFFSKMLLHGRQPYKQTKKNVMQLIIHAEDRFYYLCMGTLIKGPLHFRSRKQSLSSEGNFKIPSGFWFPFFEYKGCILIELLEYISSFIYGYCMFSHYKDTTTQRPTSRVQELTAIKHSSPAK